MIPPSAPPDAPQAFFLLSRELRDDIYSLLLADSLSNLSSLRSVSREFYSDVAPLYWANFIPRIEAWGFDGIGEQHPSFNDPPLPKPGLLTNFKNWMYKVEPEKVWDMDAFQRGLYRIDEGDLRNNGWIQKMPKDACRFVRKIQIYGMLDVVLRSRKVCADSRKGPWPSGEYRYLGPPLGSMYRPSASAGDW